MLTLEHILKPFGFNSARQTKIVRHRSDAEVDLNALHRAGQFELYQSWQGSEIFKNCEQIVSLFGTGGSQAIFVAVYDVIGVEGPRTLKLPDDFLYPWGDQENVYVYQLQKQAGFESLSERIVIDWGPGTRSWVQNFKQGGKEVVEVLPKGYVKEFPGFLDFVLRFDELKTMIDNPTSNREWHRMLASVAGVYLILDNRTGRQYVGSAYGDGGILARWSQYARTGHGGNKQLVALFDERENVERDLRISVLQTLSTSLTDREVIAYEQLHKKKLGTRAHGLNSN